MTLSETLKKDCLSITNGSPCAGQKQTQALQKGNITEQIITEIEEKYKDIAISGIDDKIGFKIVHDGRMHCRSLRATAKKICKAGREDAVAEQKRWLVAEKAVTERIKRVEDRLKAEEDRINDEKERIRKEKEEREARRIAGIIEAFAEYGVAVNYDDAAAMPGDEYLRRIGDAKQAAVLRKQQEEEERLQREEAERQLREEAESLRVAREQLEQAKKEVEELERAAREAKKAAAQEAAIKKAKEEAAEKARIAERERVEREQAASEERCRLEEEKRKEQEKANREAELLRQQQRPDREKLELFAADFLEVVHVPDMTTPAGLKIKEELEGMLQRFHDHALKRAAEL